MLSYNTKLNLSLFFYSILATIVVQFTFAFIIFLFVGKGGTYIMPVSKDTFTLLTTIIGVLIGSFTTCIVLGDNPAEKLKNDKISLLK